MELRADSDLISVRDYGTGLPSADVPKMFTRFWRGADRRDVGAGLGLSICQEITMAHGWELRGRRGDPGMIFELFVSPS